ncbi:putative lipoprotein YkyA [Bacillus sp. J14TS2]|uniref:YkyA family protein n=1 Tax=Bacillus sp. J14TS2 TaxID=2807188 RepID=UPI001B2C183E|nr:YkyA family protein [Bacillus sp. J14TS2]GIN74658.1 putative lipoprotein YkyA [Bacillus sp. J14TS2]
MKWFKRICAIGLVLVAAFFIGSLFNQYKDQKRIDEIMQALEESAQLEKIFANNQQELSIAGIEEIKLYDQLMSYQVDHDEEIKNAVNAALHSVEKQQQCLEESKENFSKAYTIMATIQPISQKVKNAQQAKTISSIEKLNEERYQLYLTYTEDYHTVITLNKKLYQQIEKQKFNEKELDDQIKEINQLYKKLQQQENQFNQYTTQFNHEKRQYYQLTKRL